MIDDRLEIENEEERIGIEIEGTLKVLDRIELRFEKEKMMNFESLKVMRDGFVLKQIESSDSLPSPLDS